MVLERGLLGLVRGTNVGESWRTWCVDKSCDDSGACDAGDDNDRNDLVWKNHLGQPS